MRSFFEKHGVWIRLITLVVAIVYGAGRFSAKCDAIARDNKNISIEVEKKLDKEQYYREFQIVSDTLKRIERKVDERYDQY